MDDAILRLRGVTKTYPGVLALNGVSADFHEGEVHALLGENGAGKSTLIKIVSGAITPDDGTIVFGDKEYTRMTPLLAKENGVEVIYQEFNLVESLSAAENICLGERLGRLVDERQMAKRARAIFDQFNVDIDPLRPVRELSPAQKQIVEIAKAVSRRVRILIMDEPSARLSSSEVEVTFDIVKNLKTKGVTVIYISHRMDEIFRISDRVTVMRDGCYVGTLETAKTNRKELVSLMVGRELKESYPKRKNLPTGVALEARNLTGNGVEDISFSVRKGEILGVAGLVGAGRTELASVVFGAAKKERGDIIINGNRVTIDSPSDAISNGLGLIPEDRQGLGCLLESDVKFNISLPILKSISKYMMVNAKEELRIAQAYRDLLDIKTPSLGQKVKNLSGGNQQKIVLAKTLAANSNILVFDEPTRGIDVGAKQEIYNLMTELADEGKAVVMISSEMEELLGMSDRIIVLARGRLVGEVPRERFDAKYVIELALESGHIQHQLKGK